MHQLPENHRFPMVKYELIPQQLLREGLVEKENFFSPELVKDYWIEKAHDKEYISKLKHLSLSKSEIRKIGFPLSKELVNREYIITQGTIDCVDFAIKYGWHLKSKLYKFIVKTKLLKIKNCIIDFGALSLH